MKTITIIYVALAFIVLASASAFYLALWYMEGEDVGVLPSSVILPDDSRPFLELVHQPTPSLASATSDSLRAHPHVKAIASKINSQPIIAEQLWREHSPALYRLAITPIDRAFLVDLEASVLLALPSAGNQLRALRLYAQLFQDEQLPALSRARVGSSIERLLVGTNDEKLRRAVFTGPLLSQITVSSSESQDLEALSRAVHKVYPVARASFFVAAQILARTYEDRAVLSTRARQAALTEADQFIEDGLTDLDRQKGPQEIDNNRAVPAMIQYGQALAIKTALGALDKQVFIDHLTATLLYLSRQQTVTADQRSSIEGAVRIRGACALAAMGEPERAKDTLAPILDPKSPLNRLPNIFAGVVNLATHGNAYERDCTKALLRAAPEFEALIKTY